MNVSELSRQTGVSAHRLRHYETLGLIRASRSASGWREFDQRSARDVHFIAKSREVGVSLKAIADALPRYRAGTLTWGEMIDLMNTRIAEVDEEIALQQAVRRKLVSAAAWFEKREQEHASRSASSASSAWNTSRRRPPP